MHFGWLSIIRRDAQLVSSPNVHAMNFLQHYSEQRQVLIRLQFTSDVLVVFFVLLLRAKQEANQRCIKILCLPPSKKYKSRFCHRRQCLSQRRTTNSCMLGWSRPFWKACTTAAADCPRRPSFKEPVRVGWEGRHLRSRQPKLVLSRSTSMDKKSFRQ
jgi:hypothetical protein